jgi:hypothetical protein
MVGFGVVCYAVAPIGGAVRHVSFALGKRGVGSECDLVGFPTGI